MDYETISARIAETGMICRGGFHPGAEDGLPAATGTAIMVGNAGAEFWRRFRAEFPARAEDPLNVWSGSILNAIAGELGAQVLFPFGGPPHHPFQRWAQRAEAVYPSPVGSLIHPTYGLWHAYRGILLFGESFPVPERRQTRSPCDDCEAKPCLNTCPVGAMTEGGFVSDPCIAHLAAPSGGDCMQLGCAARRGCPVGTQYIYEPDQAQFHQNAFFRSHYP